MSLKMASEISSEPTMDGRTPMCKKDQGYRLHVSTFGGSHPFRVFSSQSGKVLRRLVENTPAVQCYRVRCVHYGDARERAYDQINVWDARLRLQSVVVRYHFFDHNHRGHFATLTRLNEREIREIYNKTM